MSQKIPVNNFEWIENNSQFNEHFIKKTITKKVMKDTFLKLIVNTLKYLYEHCIHNDLPFLSERRKIEKSRKVCY